MGLQGRATELLWLHFVHDGMGYGVELMSVRSQGCLVRIVEAKANDFLSLLYIKIIEVLH